MARRDAPARPTATVDALAVWGLELARTAPGLASRALRPRTRERLILAVTEVNGDRFTAWVHGAWRDFLGDVPVVDAEEALLAYARACARAGRPVTPTALHEVLPPDAVRAVRATVARAELANLAGNSAGALVDRLLGRRPRAPFAAITELLATVAAAPVAMPFAGAALVLRGIERVAPPVPLVASPDGEDPNLLTHLVADALRTWLANAAVRLAVLSFPARVKVALRDGRSATTITIGRGAVSVRNGTADDALVVIDGEPRPLLRAASGSVLEQLGHLRVRRP